ncbi:MAG: hypothetical protein GY940_37275, partial [bacterium]|nr:hypothetical protein [bacterium]
EKILETVFNKIVEHHDALRMVYEVDGGGDDGRVSHGVRQRNRGLDGSKLIGFEVFRIDPAHSNPDQSIRKEVNRVQASMDLKTGPLVKLALFKTGGGDHLMIAVHHLVIDGISWRILLEDLGIGYRQIQQGKDIRFQDKTGSFLHWAQQLAGHAAGKTKAGKQFLFKEAEYWQTFEIATQTITKLPRDHKIHLKKKKNKFTNTQTVKL